MERKITKLVVGLLLLLLLTVSFACAKPAPSAKPMPSETPTAPPAEELPRAIIFGGGTSGTAWIFSGGYITLLNKYTDMSGSYREVNGYKLMAPLMEKGELDIVELTPVQPMGGYRGDPPYKRKWRARYLVAAIGKGMGYLGVFTTPDSGIKSIADLRGKRFLAEQPAGTFTTDLSIPLLKVNGMTKDDVQWLLFDQGNNAVREIVEGRADAYVYWAGSSTELLAEQKGLYCIPLTPEEQAAVHERNSAISAGVIPADFCGNPIATPTVGSPNGFFVRPSMNRLTAYTLIKTLFDHLPEYWPVHFKAEGFTKENALKTWCIPYHAGVIKYFQEIGIWTEEANQEQGKLLKIEKKLFGDVPDLDWFKELGIPVEGL